jgi:hypothetical protein
MSDDVRHGRKSLHPMSSRSAAQVAASGDCCRSRSDRIGAAQALSHRRIGMPPASDAEVPAVEPIGPRARVYVRLRRSDHALLRERAAGRGLASATYVSMLVRTHLRGMPPLPDRELAELRHAAGALGAVGRNLNQIARVAPPDRTGGRNDDRRPSSDARGLRRVAGPFQTLDRGEHSQLGERRCQSESLIYARSAPA